MRTPHLILAPALAGALLGSAAIAQADVTISRAGTVVTVIGDDGQNAIERANTNFGNPEPLIFSSKLDPTGGSGLVAGDGCTRVVAINWTYIACGTNDFGLRMEVDLKGGDDFWHYGGTPAVPMVVHGGAGNDELHSDGSTNGTRIFGDEGNDTIVGAGGNETLDGGSGDDTITGYAGNDTITGGPGRDMIDGDSTYTTGNDTIYARDDEQDTITCGFGADTVQADLLDVVTDQIDCEQVDRQQLTPPTITPQPTPGTPAPSTPGLTPLTVAPVKVTAPRLAALTRSGAVTVRAKPTAAARCTAPSSRSHPRPNALSSARRRWSSAAAPQPKSPRTPSSPCESHSPHRQRENCAPPSWPAPA
ncbi:MAG TPA: hypothetical protein PKE32_07250 [Miltoncostaeaceae bacterium]|nr:hypothetical protein [Miltoncostaeaceae bacterium]